MDLWTIFLINLVAVMIAVGSYVYLSICLQTIAEKESVEHTWVAWVPIANVYMMCRMVGASPWTMLLLFVPLVNLGYYCLLWVDVARDMGRPSWWGMMIFIPVANLIIPGYLAFAEVERAVPQLEPVQPASPEMRYHTTGYGAKQPR